MTANLLEQELRRLFTGRRVPFTEIVEASESRESYYLCSAGAIVRVLRAGGRIAGTRPAYLQLFDLNGKPIRDDTKFRESSSSFFLRKYTPALHESECLELSEQPSFIPSQNTKDFFDVVDRRSYSVAASCFGLDPGRFP